MFSRKKKLGRFLKSQKALAIPMTYLMLFVSLMAIISVTYSFAISKISVKGTQLKISVTKHNMQVLEDAISSVTWSFGATKNIYMEECGGIFQTEPLAKTLVLNFTDYNLFNNIVFNSSVGKTFYTMEASDVNNDGLYIKGDYRAIINESASTMAQLYFSAGEEAKELTLCYRPTATAVPTGLSNGKPSNLIRVYVVNLNSSENVMLREKFYLKITSMNVSTLTYQYSFNSSISSLALKAVLDETYCVVWLPVQSNAEGCAVTLEIVICNIQIERAGA